MKLNFEEKDMLFVLSKVSQALTLCSHHEQGTQKSIEEGKIEGSRRKFCVKQPALLKSEKTPGIF